MCDYTEPVLKQGYPLATSGPPLTPGPIRSHSYDTSRWMHAHLASGGPDTSNQLSSVRSELSNQIPRSPTQQLQFQTPVRHSTGARLDTQFIPPPPMLSPYTDPRAGPARVPPLPAHVTPNAADPVPETVVHITMTEPSTSSYPVQVYQPNPQVPTSHAGPSYELQTRTSSLSTPHAMNMMGNLPSAGLIPQSTEYGQSPQLQMPQATAHLPRSPLYPSTTSAWGPIAATHTPPNANQAAFGYSPVPHTQAPVYQQQHALAHQVSMYPDAVPRPALSPSPTAYGSFLQTHQVKNVQVFTGNADSKMLIEDWVRDMQYLLEAIELPPHLRFSTVVRHLSGEARKLILNLPPHDQTPEKAFGELRAEYGDVQGSLDPLADFYERSQRPGESACSYAIALEATLRAVEESQRGGRSFPDRDCKLTRQFLRGLNDEEVYMRISPMKPRLLSFRELQDELRNLAKETKKFQPCNRQKKTYAQVQVTSECKTEKAKQTEWSELTQLVKKLALGQEEQLAKLAHLESRIAAPSSASFPSPRVRPHPGPATQASTIMCHRCGKQGHVARVCRAVLPDFSQTWAHQPQPTTQAEGTTPHPSLPLNG